MNATAQQSDVSTITVTRKSGEAIVIDGPARVEVEIVGRNRVLLRTTARRTVRVLREELTRPDPQA